MEDFIRERIVDQIYLTNDFDMNLMLAYFVGSLFLIGR